MWVFYLPSFEAVITINHKHYKINKGEAHVAPSYTW